MHSFRNIAKLISGMGLGHNKVASDSAPSATGSDRDDEIDWGIDVNKSSEPRALKISGNLNKLHPILFWDPPSLTYLEPLAEVHFSAHCKDFKTRLVTGEYFFDPYIGTVLPAGKHELTCTFIPSKAHKYVSVTETRTVTVHKRRPTVIWNFPAQELLFGTILDEEHFNGVKCEDLEGGEFIFSHEAGRVLPIGKHTMQVEYEPQEKHRANYSRGYASVTFEVVGAYVPIVWKIPFCAESYTHFTKHVEDMVEASTLVVSTPPPIMPVREEVNLSRGSQRKRKKQREEEEARSAAAAQAAQEAAREFTADSAVIVTTLPSRRRSSAFTAGAPIIYPDPLPEWLFQAEAVFYNAEIQESEYVSGKFEYDPPPGAQLPAGDYVIKLTFHPDNLCKYRITTDTRKVSILKSPVPLEWPLNIGMTDGASLDERSLNCTNVLGIPGTYTYTPTFGETLPEGRHMLSVRFDPEDNRNYHAASTSIPFQVRHKKVPNIFWAEPPDIVHPFPLSKLQLNAACRGGGFYRGVFEYEPDFGTVLDAGVHELKVTFYPELRTVAVVTATVPLVVHKGLSRLIWNTPEPLIDGQGLYDDVLTCKCTNLKGGTFIYDPPKGTMLSAGPHKLCVKYIPDDPNYMEAEMYIKMQVKPKPVRAQSKYYVS